MAKVGLKLIFERGSFELRRLNMNVATFKVESILCSLTSLGFKSPNNNK